VYFGGKTRVETAAEQGLKYMQFYRNLRRAEAVFKAAYESVQDPDCRLYARLLRLSESARTRHGVVVLAYWVRARAEILNRMDRIDSRQLGTRLKQRFHGGDATVATKAHDKKACKNIGDTLKDAAMLFTALLLMEMNPAVGLRVLNNCACSLDSWKAQVLSGVLAGPAGPASAGGGCDGDISGDLRAGLKRFLRTWSDIGGPGHRGSSL
jgi:hypothetical protein